MHNVMQKNIQSTQTAKRIIAVVCLLCIVIAILLSQALVLSHAAHCHDHGRNLSEICTLCVPLNNAGNLLKALGLAAGGSLFTLVILYTAIPLLSMAVYICSPIELRIRMNH